MAIKCQVADTWDCRILKCLESIVWSFYAVIGLFNLAMGKCNLNNTGNCTENDLIPQAVNFGN